MTILFFYPFKVCPVFDCYLKAKGMLRFFRVNVNVSQVQFVAECTAGSHMSSEGYHLGELLLVGKISENAADEVQCVCCSPVISVIS